MALLPLCLFVASWKKTVQAGNYQVELKFEKDNELVQRQEGHLGPGEAVLHHREDGHRHRPDSGDTIPNEWTSQKYKHQMQHLVV